MAGNGLGSESAKLKTVPIQTPPNDRKEQVTLETETISLTENALSQTPYRQRKIYQYVGNYSSLYENWSI